ncbi:MAG: NAD(P)H-binding protein [Gemmatimonadaceae bacterium]
MSVVVTTPTGYVGSRVVECLLAADVPLTLVARDPSRLPVAARERATIVQGSLDDPAVLRRAARGADALLVVVPVPSPAHDWRDWHLALGRNAAEAVRDGDVRRVVLLSSVGARCPDSGPARALGEVEELLAAVTPNLVRLRAGYFMENFRYSLRTIVEQGMIFGGFPAEQPLRMVAMRDVGEVAARWLGDASWSGTRTVGAHGPADVSHADAARAIGQLVGRTITYVQVTLDQMGQALAALGLGPSIVDGYQEFVGAYSREPRFVAEPRTPESTTPTTFAQFARDVLKPPLDRAAVAAAARRSSRH